jgi:hypothetical protein
MVTAHKVMVTVKDRNGIRVFPYTTTDVNTAFFLAPDGGNQLVLSSQDCYIVDLVHSTQGSCTQDYIWFNNVRLPDIIYTAASQPTGVNRQVRSNPLFVPAGTQVKFQTIT